ncbi:MAG: hypothetical protein JRG84_13040 [Deltaproteobacteria bacterium]|nr:hypothetical protein [Deltaproteobacteria bacterium]
MARNLCDPNAKMLNHAELVYAPGERDLVARFFRALGCRVLDPQTDPLPENLGPAAGPYLIIYLDAGDDDVIDNLFYASEVLPVQWEFEKSLRAQLSADKALAEAERAMRKNFAQQPQAMTHLGLAFPSVDELEAAVERIGADPELADRAQLSKIYRPGEPGHADERVVQTFVHTDLCSGGVLTTGQQFELQVRLDL